MPNRSEFMRVCVEGATSDGRHIERDWIAEAASSYNRETYAARVNIEHIRGFSGEKPFNAYGDVIALKAEEVTIDLDGKPTKRMGLFAQVDALDNLIELNAKGQKLYPSCEFQPNFAATGKAYLVGLAITDNPASLGTEVMKFAAENPKASPFAHRKRDPENVFAEIDDAIDLKFTDDSGGSKGAESAFGAIGTFFEALTVKFSRETPPPPPPALDDKPDSGSADLARQLAPFAEGMQKLATETGDQFAVMNSKIEALQSSIETTEKPGDERPKGGGANFSATDC